nr:exocyst complex component EXO70A1-like [Ipomoea batatas]
MRNPSSPPHYTFCETLLADTIATVEPVIRKWDVQASATIARISYLFRDSPVEAKQFLGCVDDLQRAMRFSVTHCSDSELLVRAQTLMQIAMKRASSQSTVPDSEGDSPQEDGDVLDKVAGISIPDSAVADLKAIATCMIGAGYGKECAKVYNMIRKSVIDETLYHLGIENFNSSQIQKMDWEVLERKILNWQSCIRIAVKTHFLGERILCDEVFSAFDHIRESCFAEISKDGAINLFGFLELAAKYKKISIEKMFRYLDLHEAVSDLSPEIESIFSFDSTAAVKSQAAATEGFHKTTSRRLNPFTYSVRDELPRFPRRLQRHRFRNHSRLAAVVPISLTGVVLLESVVHERRFNRLQEVRVARSRAPL